MRFSIGVHRTRAKFSSESNRAPRIVARGSTPSRCQAIGEIGLDYYYDLAPQQIQPHVFRDQIVSARRRRLLPYRDPHAGRAGRYVSNSLRGVGQDVGGVFHCSRGASSDGAPRVDLGFHISLAGS